MSPQNSLPNPSTLRWAPLRLGLKNLYKYDDEELQFSGGRLLLRGNNGTGKTRILALTLPFLFDGEVRPARVEPDADPSRRIEWHLLMDRHHERIGYTWIEFGRLDGDQPRFVTLGCGMRALAGHQGLRDRWFFVTMSRIGQELALSDAVGAPLSHEKLNQALEGRGTVYETAIEYRRAVDSALFGLGERRYAALIDLLLELRRPQLSRKLDEKILSDALSQALTSLDESTINDLAEAYASLEQDRRQLQLVQASVAAIESFNASHRKHVAAHAKRIADDVRQTHHRYDAAQTAVREAEKAKAQATADLEHIQKAVEEADQRREEALAAERALRKSPEMKTAGRLAELRESASNAKARRDADARSEQDCAKDLEAAASHAAQARKQSEAAQKTLASAKTAVDGHCSQFAIPSRAEEPTPAAVNRLKEGLASLRTAASELRRLSAQVRVEMQRHEIEQARVKAAEDQRDDALRASGDATERAKAASRQYLADVVAYLKSVVECQLDQDAVSTALASWIETPEGESPLRAVLAEAVAVRESELLAQRAANRHADGLLSEQVGTLKTEASKLESGSDPLPTAPPYRQEATRKGRPGAPFWRVIDFKKGLTTDSRAGYEAALQASGLLDAWLHPDGNLTLTPDGDTYLSVHEGHAGDAGLDTVMTVSIDSTDAAAAHLSTDVVAKALRSIGCRAGAGTCWVSSEGHWQNGPTRGAWAKNVAEFIGSGARAAARKRRLAEIAVEVANLEGRRRKLKEEGSTIDAAIETLRSEQRRAPTERHLLSTWALSRSEAARYAKAQESVSTTQQTVAASHGILIKATSSRDDFASDAKLSSWIEREGDLSEALATFSSAVDGLRYAADAFERNAAQCSQAEKLKSAAGSRLADAKERHRVSSLDAAKIVAELKELDSSQGAAVKTVLKRLDELAIQVNSAQQIIEAERNKEKATFEALGEAKAAEKTAREQLEESTSARVQAIRILREVAAGGLLAVLRLAPEAPSSSSPDTVVLEFARALAREVKDVPSDEKDIDQLHDEATSSFQTLQQALSSADMAPTAETHHGILHIRVPFQGQQRGAVEVEALLREDVAQRHQLLSAQERKVIENFLLDEAAAHLHNLLYEADRWVAKVNRELESRPMSTGMALRFRWTISSDAPKGATDARERLLRPSHLWSAEDRQGLADFLQKQIEVSKERASTMALTWQEQLSEALDYRRWHRFTIERTTTPGKWVPLTKKTHGTSSGGEKAVALTMPQFAAAAAHYQAAPTAPRLILLDEAFVGIDNDMRRECMGLLAAFDLDVVMTSEREWGCYDTVPSLSIYQLAAAGDCVAATRYVWDGKRRIRESQPV